MIDHRDPPGRKLDEVTALIYELLDAHADTLELVDGPCADLRWAGHVEYLRDLQRVGREALARLCAGDAPATIHLLAEEA